jgi:hypothetical protein
MFNLTRNFAARRFYSIDSDLPNAQGANSKLQGATPFI